ncbi:MAG TPA: Crp/Fnr family transcriptional regulator [Candidatus Saccharimonadales bacterium]|jgi:CRP/FNR family transcriptional regulator
MPTSDKWREFSAKYQHRVYRRGQIILFQGESPRYAYLIKKGLVKIYNIDYDGKEQFIDLESTGATFPKLWIWGKENNAQYYYEALSDCDIYVIPRDAYLNFVKSDPELVMAELSSALSDYRNSSTRLNALLYTRASDKLAHILRYLANTYAPNSDKENLVINIKLTHQHLASLTGLTRETVSVELNKFKAMGVVNYKPSEYRINVRKLDQILKKEF